MKLLHIIHEDFVNYKLPSMTLEFPYCSFKCNIESNHPICHNTNILEKYDIKDIAIRDIIDSYINNPITSSIVMQGLEPFDSWEELLELIKELRGVTQDDIIIYTGYCKYEIVENIKALKQFDNIIIKVGRYMPGYEPHMDNVLGVKLASDNQYAKRIEDL